MIPMMGTEYTKSKFDDDTKLGGVTETPDGCAAIQRNLDKQEKWANRNVMKFSKERYEVLHLERNNPVHQYMMAIARKELMTFAAYALKQVLSGETCCRKTSQVPGHKLQIRPPPRALII
ncbi:hypothetical protein WISP_106189 [Willisornis vidua]|uniref:Uncharacterized protein n=1 Tax=Willisornis vidua TaxID=1566151 RepID=A0ABQ9CWX5_9PASS|nr:hypothetical protein WISP_106189 [Willisornis vidua]